MREKNALNAGDVYAFTASQDVGFFIVLVEFGTLDKNTVGCVSLPDMQNCAYTADELFMLLDNKAIELVDNLPDDVYISCKEHYCTQSKHLSDVVSEIFAKNLDPDDYEITLTLEGE